MSVCNEILTFFLPDERHRQFPDLICFLLIAFYQSIDQSAGACEEAGGPPGSSLPSGAVSVDEITSLPGMPSGLLTAPYTVLEIRNRWVFVVRVCVRFCACACVCALSLSVSLSFYAAA